MLDIQEIAAIKVLHDEGSQDYLINYRYNTFGLIKVLDEINRVNNFNPGNVINFIKKVENFYFENVTKSILNTIYFKFGKESSSVLYIELDMDEKNLKRMLNSINQLKRKLEYNEYNVEKDKLGRISIRIWFD